MDLTHKQAVILRQFRETLADVLQEHHDDYYLLRWLKARNWDVKKAEKMLRDSLSWRASYGADTLISDYHPPEVLRNHLPGGYFGVDKEGHPTYIERIGTVDFKGIFCSVKKDVFNRHKFWQIETLCQEILPRLSQQYGHRVQCCNLIYDLEGFGLRHLHKPAIDALKEQAKILEANYPEVMGTYFIINAPKLVSVAYAIFKPVLPEETRNKLKFLGGNWKNILLQYYDPDQLPVAYGGTATDPDGDIYCSSKIGRGGEVPSEYRKNSANIDLTQFTETHVTRGSALQVPVDVAEAGDVLSWQFVTEGKDIVFGVHRRTEDTEQQVQDMVDIVTSQKVNSHVMMEEGSVSCDTPGTYVLYFDNSGSWINSKQLFYQFEVYSPDRDFQFITKL